MPMLPPLLRCFMLTLRRAKGSVTRLLFAMLRGARYAAGDAIHIDAAAMPLPLR